MPATQDIVHALEHKVNELLQRQLKSLERPLLSMTYEEAMQYAADRKELNALIEKLAYFRARDTQEG
jgi:hypothetical protein